MYDLIIIGGGPAAFSAMAYALGKQLDALLIYEALGGKTGMQQVESGTLDMHLAHLSTEQVEHIHQLQVRTEQERLLPMHEAVRLLVRQTLGHPERLMHGQAQVVMREDDGFLVGTDAHGTLQSRSVIVATGASPILLQVPGVERVARYGLGYSIATYAHLAAGKRVAVIGESNRALRGAAELASMAERVYLITPNAALPRTALVDALWTHPAVEILTGYEVVEIAGEDGLDALILKQETKVKRLPIDRAFVALGLLPRSELVKELACRDQEGFIVVDARGATTQPGLFAAGDVTTRWVEQIQIAIGDGARAAVSAYEYLLAHWLLPHASHNA